MDIKKLKEIVENTYFEKDIMKVKFDTDDDLVFNKIINAPMCATVVKLFMNMIINFILKYIYIVVILIVLMMSMVLMYKC